MRSEKRISITTFCGTDEILLYTLIKHPIPAFTYRLLLTPFPRFHRLLRLRSIAAELINPLVKKMSSTSPCPLLKSCSNSTAMSTICFRSSLFVVVFCEAARTPACVLAVDWLSEAADWAVDVLISSVITCVIIVKTPIIISEMHVSGSEVATDRMIFALTLSLSPQNYLHSKQTHLLVLQILPNQRQQRVQSVFLHDHLRVLRLRAARQQFLQHSHRVLRVFILLLLRQLLYDRHAHHDLRFAHVLDRIGAFAPRRRPRLRSTQLHRHRGRRQSHRLRRRRKVLLHVSKVHFVQNSLAFLRQTRRARHSPHAKLDFPRGSARRDAGSRVGAAVPRTGGPVDHDLVLLLVLLGRKPRQLEEFSAG